MATETACQSEMAEKDVTDTCGAETEVHEEGDGVLEGVVREGVVVLQHGHQPPNDALLYHQ